MKMYVDVHTKRFKNYCEVRKRLKTISRFENVWSEINFKKL